MLMANKIVISGTFNGDFAVTGESVVVDGNFLIDAESNLRAGAQSLGHAHGGKSAPTTVAPAAPSPHAGH